MRMPFSLIDRITSKGRVSQIAAMTEGEMVCALKYLEKVELNSISVLQH